MEANSPEPEQPKVEKRGLGRFLFGPPKDVRDPSIFHKLSLIAFLGWVGLGSDGLSSSCYGPEEAFIALGHHQYLAVFLAMMMALTVFVIAASYSQTIELFPNGGGGYLVATTLLGPYAGLLSGGALVIDYVLTIAISIASGADAIFSFLPPHMLHYKLAATLIVVLLMILMNLWGVKESVLSLVPIFIAFVVMHVWLVSYVLISRGGQIPTIFRDAAQQVHTGVSTLGVFGLAVVFFSAYSLGGGTYTGIEAVSSGMPILREPRAKTGKRTMLYMALSLAFIAGGILFGYMLENVEPVVGKTLNAVLFEKVAANWTLGGIHIGMPIVTFTLLTEGVLLFVAAQTGFIGGPQVLATMAHDRWLPRRFSYLSTRLVTADGVLAMGITAVLILIGTEAEVRILVILYAINVFITFTLSQLGMSVHWWNSRKTERQWLRKLMVNGVGCVFTFSILTIMLLLKFDEGGWVTVALTGGLIALCYFVREHYAHVGKAVQQLEADILPKLYEAKAIEEPAPPDPEAPTAVLLVNGFNGLGLATLLNVRRLFPNEFRNVVFIGVGEVDAQFLKSRDELDRLEKHLHDDLLSYCEFASQLGFHPELRIGLNPDVVEELHKLCVQVAREHKHCVFFAGKLVFGTDVEGFIARFLHNHTAFELQNWLQVHGMSLVIMPIRVGMAAQVEPSGEPLSSQAP